MKSQLIVALDVATTEVALEVAKTLREVVHFYKVGLELFTSVGPGLVGDFLSLLDQYVAGRYAG